MQAYNCSSGDDVANVCSSDAECIGEKDPSYCNVEQNKEVNEKLNDEVTEIIPEEEDTENKNETHNQNDLTEKMLKLDEEKDNKLKDVTFLKSKKDEMHHVAQYLHLEKNRYNRQVRSLVKALQQDILAKGRAIASEIDAAFDAKIARVTNNLSKLDEEMKKRKEIANKITKVISASKDDFMEKFDNIYAEIEADEPLELDVPTEEVYEIGTKEISKCIDNMSFVKEDLGKVELPSQTINEGDVKEVTVVGLWMAKRHAFHVTTRNREALQALHDYSYVIRKAYLQDMDWKTFGDMNMAPAVNDKVFARFNEDKNWSRAKILDVDEAKKQCVVLFVDWGHVDHAVRWSDLLPFKQDIYTDTEPWAFECVFTEEDDPNASREARWWFNTTASDIANACVPIKCSFKTQVDIKGSPAWIVEMEAVKPDGSVVNIGETVKEKMMEGSKPKSRIACRDIREEFTKTTVIENPKLDAEKREAAEAAKKLKEEEARAKNEKPSTNGKAEDTSNKDTAEKIDDKVPTVANTTAADTSTTTTASNPPSVQTAAAEESSAADPSTDAVAAVSSAADDSSKDESHSQSQDSEAGEKSGTGDSLPVVVNTESSQSKDSSSVAAVETNSVSATVECTEDESGKDSATTDLSEEVD